MYIDFREERKWKLALAYNLSTAVLEWHAAGCLKERVDKGICVLWKRPHIEDAEADENIADPTEDEMLVDPQPREKELNPLAIVDYGSDDDDEDEEPDKDQSIIDVLEPTALVQDAFESVNRENDPPHDDSSKMVEPKVEEVEDTSALQSTRVDDQGESMDVDVPEQPAVEEGGETKTEVHSPAATPSLKPTSGDPILGSVPTVEDGDAIASSKATAPKPKLYAPLRERIAYSDPQKLFLDFDDLELIQGLSSLSTEDNPVEALPPAPDLSAIFPDLPQFGMLDVAPPIAPSVSTEGRKKSEKRSDKDDPNKRAEDSTYTKLAPLGKFMYRKPTLLGPLQPAKCWKQGQWSNVEEGAVSAESDGPFARVADDTTCGECSGPMFGE
jgi:chromatin modification-related protein VID21